MSWLEVTLRLEGGDKLVSKVDLLIFMLNFLTRLESREVVLAAMLTTGDWMNSVVLAKDAFFDPPSFWRTRKWKWMKNLCGWGQLNLRHLTFVKHDISPNSLFTILSLSCISIVKVTRDVGEMGDVTGVYCFPGTHPICPKWDLVMSDLGNTNALQRIKPYLLVLDFTPFLESKGVVNTWVQARQWSP